MFTGIIEAIGEIKQIEDKSGDRRFTIATGDLDMSDVALGDSIACNGVCLTAIEFGSDFYVADVSRESLELTTLGKATTGMRVNLEKALTPTSRLGGHMVSGHVDGIGIVISLKPDSRSVRYQIEAPQNLARYIAKKGSITVDGVSLTVNQIEGRIFELNIVPHTLEKTIINDYKAGTQVNLEVDLIARYLERLIQGSDANQQGLSYQQLMSAGFIKGSR